jgi:hypothetical protein
MKLNINGPRIVLISSGLLVIFVVALLVRYNRSQEYDLQLICKDNVWGYAISRDKKIIIYQEYMPGLQGKIAFSDRGTAKKTGQLVIEKMKRNELPAITKEELDSILNIDK